MAKGTFKCMASGMWSIYELLVRKAWTPSPAILGHHDFRDLEWISVPCQIEPCKGAQVPFALQKALYTRISNTRSLLIIQKEKGSAESIFVFWNLEKISWNFLSSLTVTSDATLLEACAIAMSKCSCWRRWARCEWLWLQGIWIGVGQLVWVGWIWWVGCFYMMFLLFLLFGFLWGYVNLCLLLSFGYSLVFFFLAWCALALVVSCCLPKLWTTNWWEPHGAPENIHLKSWVSGCYFVCLGGLKNALSKPRMAQVGDTNCKCEITCRDGYAPGSQQIALWIGHNDQLLTTTWVCQAKITCHRQRYLLSNYQRCC